MNNLSSYRYKAEPYVVCLSAALFFFFLFIQVNMFNAINPALIKTFHVDPTELGKLSDRYFLANVLFLVPAGMLLDRFSTRRVIILAMLFSVLATFGFAISQFIWQAEICRFVVGICGSFCLLSAVRISSRWFPPRKMALIIGLCVTLAMLGGMLAQGLSMLTDNYGWRHTLMLDSGIGMLTLLVIMAFVKDRPSTPLVSTCHEHPISTMKDFFLSLTKVAIKPQNWLAGLYTSFMNLPVFIIGAMWGSLYLVQTDHVTRSQASIITMMIFLGMIIGSPAVGWISDHFRRRKIPMIIGAIAALINIYAIMYVPHLSLFSLCFLFFTLGLIISAQIIGYPVIAESNPPNVTATAESLASVLIMAGGFTQPLFAELLEQGWDGKMINHLPVYSVANFHHGFIIMPIAFILSLVAALFIKETHCVALQVISNNTTKTISLEDEEPSLVP